MDMKICGSGSIAAGEYDEINCAGSVKATGNIRCKKLVCAGLLSGDAEIFCAGSVRISGSAKIGKELSADVVHSDGSLHCGGLVKCNTLDVAGGIKAESIEAENARIHGVVNCTGLLNAEGIQIEYENSSFAGSIGGGKIKIVRKNKILGFFRQILKNKGAVFTVKDSIEGDEIELEHVNAETVSGRIVVIGAGCRVARLCYSEHVEISPDAEVGFCEKL